MMISKCDTFVCSISFLKKEITYGLTSNLRQLVSDSDVEKVFKKVFDRMENIYCFSNNFVS